MENQTRFDLNAAIENWRKELASQPSLAIGDRRELETHLRDTISGFQQRGLNDEESFWLARRRVGQPQQLGEEFVKADPAKVWRERLFWALLFSLLFTLWSNLINCLPFWWTTGWFSLPIALLHYLPFLGMVIVLAKGELDKRYYALADFFHTRLRFALGATVFFVVIQSFHGVMYYTFLLQQFHNYPAALMAQVRANMLSQFWANHISGMIWPIMLVVLATWLLPAKKPTNSMNGSVPVISD